MSDSIEKLRSLHRANRAALNENTLHSNAANLLLNVSAQNVYRRAQKVAAYIAIRGEIEVSGIITQGAQEGKQFYLPVLRDESMYFVPWSPDQPLVKKQFGLLEPDVPLNQSIAVHELDLVLAPLVVFDSRCNRIGQGGGFYDRTFAHKQHAPTEKPVLMGVAHESQREDQLSPESWDIPLDLIVTNASVYHRP